VPRGRGVNVAQLLEKARPLKFGRAKFGAISDNFPLRSRMSPELIHISKIRKVVDQLQPLPRWTKKDGELWSTNKKVIPLGANVDPSKWIFAQFLTTFHFDSPDGVSASGTWTTQNCLCCLACGARRPYVGLCPIFLVIIILEVRSEIKRKVWNS